MPLRFLQYVTREYEKLVSQKSLYANKLVKIPTPGFVVFYNGIDKQPDQQILKLSDAYQRQEDQPQLELLVRVLNISGENNHILKEQCQTLGDYMKYVERVRKYAQERDINIAVKLAVDECIQEGILKDF